MDELTSHRQRHVMSNDVDFFKCPLMPLWPALLLVSCLPPWLRIAFWCGLVDMKRYEDTSPLRDISQHILDILDFDVLPDCSGSNWIHLEDIRQNEQLGSQVYISETAIAWARLRKAAADAMKKSKYEGFEVQELYIHFSFRLCYPRCCIFFKETSTRKVHT